MTIDSSSRSHPQRMNLRTSHALQWLLHWNPCLHAQFRRRFRMRKPLFLWIVNAVEAHDLYFQQKRDCARSLDLSTLQRVTAAVRMFAYGVAADAMDNYVRITKSTAIESLKMFVKAIIDDFGNKYLGTPNNAYICRLLSEGKKRGFLGMLGSIDCMHWKWKNCPLRGKACMLVETTASGRTVQLRGKACMLMETTTSLLWFLKP